MNSYTILLFIVIVLFICKQRICSPKSKGHYGEYAVNRRLQKLPKEYHLMYDTVIPSKYGTTQVDQIVISSHGIFVIETKNYSGWIFGDERSNEWKETFKTRQVTFRNPIKQNWAHIYALSEVLNVDKKYFIPIVAFSDKAKLKVTSSAKVIHFSDLNDVILSYSDEIITLENVKKIINILDAAKITTENVNKEHLNNVKINMDKEEKMVRNGICPRCHGTLIVREGKFGKFYGCSNYPKCKYTHKV